MIRTVALVVVLGVLVAIARAYPEIVPETASVLGEAIRESLQSSSSKKYDVLRAESESSSPLRPTSKKMSQATIRVESQERTQTSSSFSSAISNEVVPAGMSSTAVMELSAAESQTEPRVEPAAPADPTKLPAQISDTEGGRSETTIQMRLRAAARHLAETELTR